MALCLAPMTLLCLLLNLLHGAAAAREWEGLRAPIQRRRLGQDPCVGVTCPANAACQAVSGTASCACQSPYKRIISNKCSSANVAHSDFLDLQNNVRAAVGSASLSWNETLAAKAQAWAASLAGNYSCKMVEEGSSAYGQNLATSTSLTADNSSAVLQWIGEGQSYNYAQFNPPKDKASGCNTGDWNDCSDFIQMIWNGSVSVGCGVAKCASSKIWVCDYSPPGLQPGKYPYTQGVPVTNVSSSDPSCKGVSCPSNGGYCRTMGDASPATPVCSCPLGYSISGSKCVSSTVYGIPGTSLAFYNASNWANTPALVRASPFKCFDVPKAYLGNVGSYKIVWDVKDPRVATGSTIVKCSSSFTVYSAAKCGGTATVALRFKTGQNIGSLRISTPAIKSAVSFMCQ